MTEYTYNNGVLRIKSDSAVLPQSYITITREDTEKITTTEYRLGLKIKSEHSGGYYYAWYSASPQTVTVDNSPKMNAVQEVVDQNRADVDFLMVMGGYAG